MTRAAAASVSVVSVALTGLTSTAIRRLRAPIPAEVPTALRQLAVKKLIPVTLPPGRARLATRPSLTGFSLTMKTMGIVVVAALAAIAAGVPVAAITVTRRRTRSAASSGSRSYWPSAQRYIDCYILAFDIADVFEAMRNARKRSDTASGDLGVKKADHRHRRLLCARRSGHAAAAPPTRAMNSRRLMVPSQRRLTLPHT